VFGQQGQQLTQPRHISATRVRASTRACSSTMATSCCLSDQSMPQVLVTVSSSENDQQ
jgi:hypothetical protein